MKNRHFVIITGIAAALTFILRGLDYLFFIGKDGYYTGGAALAYAVSILLFAVAAFAFVIMLSKTKDQAEHVIAKSKTTGILSVLAGIITMLFSGWAALSLSSAVPTVLHRALLLVGILAAVYLAFFGVSVISGRFPPLVRIFGFLPAIFACLYGVCEFYQAFDRAQQSGTAYFMLSLCALSLYLTTLFYSAVGAPVTLKRLTATAVLLPPFALAWVGGYTVGCITGGAQFTVGHCLIALLLIIFSGCAFITLSRLDKRDVAEAKPSTISDGLNTYYNEIPTEETDEQRTDS